MALCHNNFFIGQLLELAQKNDGKKVLGKYRQNLSYNSNRKNLKTFLNSVLEKCAEFFQLHVRSQDASNSQMNPNKDVLVDRIIMKMESFLETKCDECEDQ